jgi:hypothetical protein
MAANRPLTKLGSAVVAKTDSFARVCLVVETNNWSWVPVGAQTSSLMARIRQIRYG